MPPTREREDGALPPRKVRKVETHAGAEASSSDVHEVFVKFLPRDVDEAELAGLFSHCGPLAKPPVLLRDFASGAPKGAGWVTFTTAAAAQTALKRNGHPLRGRHLEVTLATCRRDRPGLRGGQQAAGTHTPALLKEVLSALVRPQPSGVFVDATFGRGGHTRGLLSAIAQEGEVHAFDMDPLAVAAGEQLAAEDARFHMHSGAFSGMVKTLREKKGLISGILFDLGISSPQLDDPSRGFRPEEQGPLDLRFDVSRGEPAWAFLQRASREELLAALLRNGDGQDAATARRVADAIVLTRDVRGEMLRSTSELAALVAEARCGGDYQPMHAAKLTFQALRMHLNDEFGELTRGMRAAFKLLQPGGRMGIITWKHSECAVVMDFLRSKELAHEAFPLRAWWETERADEPLRESWGLTRGEAIRPGAAELTANSRARSAVLHILHKQRGVRVSTVERAVHDALGWDSLDIAAVADEE